MSQIETTTREKLLERGFHPENVEATLKYNAPWMELARVMELIEQKKGVINSYGKYEPTTA